MRKWLGIGTIVLLGAAGAFWHFDVVTRLKKVEVARNSPPDPVSETNAPGEEECEPLELEPLLVEGPTSSAVRCEPSEDVPLARVVLAPGMRQPPRPDAQTGNVMRMPYADEDENPPMSWQSVGSFLRSAWSRVSCALSSLLPRNPGHAVESEQKDVSTVEPEALPMPESNPAMDYHRQHPHCPYTGGCPSYYR